jgi:hypothetical protein
MGVGHTALQATETGRSDAQSDVKVTVTNYRIETVLENGSSSRRRLLILRDGERKGSIVLDSDEEGVEIIRKLSGEPAGLGRLGWARAAVRRRVGIARSLHRTEFPAANPSVSFKERLVWLTLASVSWAITLSALVGSHIL